MAEQEAPRPGAARTVRPTQRAIESAAQEANDEEVEDEHEAIDRVIDDELIPDAPEDVAPPPVAALAPIWTVLEVVDTPSRGIILYYTHYFILTYSV